MERLDSRLNDVGRCVEVRLTDFEVNDFFALFFESASAVQDFKGGFSAEPRHPAGKTQFELSCGRHSGGWNYSALAGRLERASFNDNLFRDGALFALRP